MHAAGILDQPWSALPTLVPLSTAPTVRDGNLISSEFAKKDCDASGIRDRRTSEIRARSAFRMRFLQYLRH